MRHAGQLGRKWGARPRVAALVGPYGSGKTTLCDAMLAAAGAPASRPGEKAGRGAGLRVAGCSFMGDRWALLDCPGSVEFFYDAQCALAVADLAVVVCEPAPEKAVAVGPLLRALHEAGIPQLLFINKMDTLTGRVRDTLAALQTWSPQKLVLRQVPIRDGEKVTGYVDLASERGYRYRKGEASQLIAVPSEALEREREARSELLETLADHDDALLEKILEDVAPSSDEVYRDLHKDLAEGAIVPVLLGAGKGRTGCGGCGRRCATMRQTRRRRPRGAASLPKTRSWGAGRCCRCSAPCTRAMPARSRPPGFGGVRCRTGWPSMGSAWPACIGTRTAPRQDGYGQARRDRRARAAGCGRDRGDDRRL